MMIGAWQKNRHGVLLMLAASLLTAAGQYCWKLAAGSNGWLIVAGMLLFIGNGVLMLQAFRYGEYSVLQPVQSFSYVLAIFAGWLLLQEQVPPTHWLGVALIVIGVALLGGSE